MEYCSVTYSRVGGGVDKQLKLEMGRRYIMYIEQGLGQYCRSKLHDLAFYSLFSRLHCSCHYLHDDDILTIINVLHYSIT